MNRFKIQIIGKEEIKDEEWAALLFRIVDYVENKLNLKNKFHVHLEDMEEE